jgi:choline dehydrogenase-like flavoprotein
VACGTFGTPAVLFRSGYGRKDVLGANLIAENDNVGRNIDARPSFGGVTGTFSDELSDGDYKDGGFYVNQYADPSRLIDGLQISFSADPMATLPEFMATSPQAPQFGKEHKEFMRRLYDPSATGSKARAMLLRRGQVGSSITRPAQVLGHVDERGQFQYDLRNPALIKRFEGARDIAADILKKMGAKELLNATGPVRSSSQTMQVGSCRAGKDRSNSVINSDFESHDVDNLLIADGSSLPRDASYGYGAPVATVATYAAQRIVAKHFPGKA